MFGNHDIGKRGENEAERFLRNLRYRVLKRNVRIGRLGEIDIVCSFEKRLVFVEVKALVAQAAFNPEDHIPHAKQRGHAPGAIPKQ